MRYEYKDKVVVVTGGGSGMGKVACEKFAEEGATVCVLDLNGAAATATVEGILAKGGLAAAYVADISNEEQMEKAFAEIHAAHGRIDVLFNNAGISPEGTVGTTSFADFQKVLAIDLHSVFLGCKCALPYMEKQGGGVILNNAGTFGIKPIPNKAGYACAKAGVVSLTRSVAIDFAKQNIRCNAICPGFVDTPLNKGFTGEARDTFLAKYQPMELRIQAEDIANTALFLASDAARAITGQLVAVDGGTEACLYY